MKMRERSWVMRLLAWTLALILMVPWNVMAEIPAQNQGSSAAEGTVQENGETIVTVKPEEHFSAVNYMGGYTVRFLKSKPQEGQELEDEDIIAVAENVEIGPLSAVMEGETLPEEYCEGGSMDARWSHAGDYIVAGDLDVWLTSGEFAASIGENSYATLQEAINDSKAGDTILLLKNVEENVTSEDKSYTLDLQGHSITPSPNSTASLCLINGGTVTLKNGKLTGAASAQGAGLRISGAAVNINRLEVSGNTVTDRYGSVLLENGASVTAEHFTVSNNTSQRYGGGIAVLNSTLSLSNSQVSGNTVEHNYSSYNKGAGIYAENSSVTISNTTISDNRGIGGVGICAEGGTLSVAGSTISNNRNTLSPSTGEGGGIYAGGQANVTIGAGCRITGNATGDGGGLYLGYKVSCTVAEGLEISGNSAWRQGGGICLVGTESLILSGIQITGNGSLNTSGCVGAGIFGSVQRSGTLTLKNCTISGNSGKSIVQTNGSGYETKLTGCIIENNTSEEAAVNPWVDICLENCVIQNNTASEGVGGMMLDGYGVTLTNTIVKNNTGKTAGGIYIDTNSPVRINGGAVYGNVSADGRGANDLYIGTEASDVTVLDASEMKDGEADFSGYNWYDSESNAVFEKALSHTDETADKLYAGQEYMLTAGKNTV